MASTQQKYSKLQKSDSYTSANSKQLIYPLDLINIQDEHPGHVVVFEPNIIRGHKITSYEEGMTTPDVALVGAYGSEVAMQQANSPSIRAKRGFSDITASNKLYTKTDERIILPMPGMINTTYAANWQTTDIGSLGRALDATNSVKDGNYMNALKQVGDGATRTLAGAIQALGVGQAKDYAEIVSGYSANSFTELLFKGMNNRMIPFTYIMSPKNQKEAEIVRSIIHRFKYHMSPEYKYEQGNNSFMLHPSTFDITFLDLNSGDRNQWLHKVSTCALTNLSVNGTPNGEYSVLENGQFTVVTIDLMFTEMVTLGKEFMVAPTDTY